MSNRKVDLFYRQLKVKNKYRVSAFFNDSSTLTTYPDAKVCLIWQEEGETNRILNIKDDYLLQVSNATSDPWFPSLFFADKQDALSWVTEMMETEDIKIDFNGDFSYKRLDNNLSRYRTEYYLYYPSNKSKRGKHEI